MKLQIGLKDLQSWMTSNLLLLNSNKTEDIVTEIDHIATLGGLSLNFSSSVRNLGMTFDLDQSFNSQIKMVSRSTFFHLGNIAKIMRILTQCDAKKHIYIYTVYIYI